MAIFAATEFVIEVGGVDLSDHINQVELPVEVAELDSTNFASEGWTEQTGGLKSWSATIGFLQDFDAAQVDATLWPLLGTHAALTVKPRDTTVSATNPSYEGTVLVSRITPISGQVGALAAMSVTWPGKGKITRETS